MRTPAQNSRVRPGVPVPYRFVFAFVLLVGLLSGCTSRYDNPIAVMLDRQASTHHRLAAAQQAAHDAASASTQYTPKYTQEYAQEYTQALGAIAWSDRHPTELRLLAINQLIEQDLSQFLEAADQRIVKVDHWPVLQHLFDHAVASQWQQFTRPIIRSYARPSQIYGDLDRPERDAIQRLRPGQSVEQVVWDQFVNRDGDATIADQIAAWTLLNRLVDPDTLRAQLDQGPANTMLVQDLQEARQVLDVLPHNAEGLMWLTCLLGVQRENFWDKTLLIGAQMTDQQRRGLALRHLPGLVLADTSQRALNLEQITRRITNRLAQSRHITRSDGATLSNHYTEALADQLTHLAWADLLCIDLLLQAIEEPDLIRSLFAQAYADQADTTTEYGGVLGQEADRYHAIQFPPELTAHDRKFYASRDLIQRMYTGLAHYHFHAQQYNNSPFAGPGPGDLAFADNLSANCIVFTLIDRNTLNIDYYQPGNIIIDLGTIPR